MIGWFFLLFWEKVGFCGVGYRILRGVCGGERGGGGATFSPHLRRKQWDKSAFLSLLSIRKRVQKIKQRKSGRFIAWEKMGNEAILFPTSFF